MVHHPPKLEDATLDISISHGRLHVRQSLPHTGKTSVLSATYLWVRSAAPHNDGRVVRKGMATAADPKVIDA